MLYHFGDDYSLQLIEDYKISRLIIIFSAEDQARLAEGMKLLCEHTIKTLDELYEHDDLGALVYFEAYRFLACCIEFQHHFEAAWYSYFRDILYCFHRLGYLSHKKEVLPYKQFKKKTILFKLKYVGHEGETKIFSYYSAKNMAIDFTRYSVDRIMERYPRQTVLTLDIMRNLMER